MPVKIEWKKHDPYYATWDIYTLTRCVVCGQDLFNVYVGNRHVRINFKDAKEAVEWIKWVEGQSRDPIEAKANNAPLSEAEMEIL